MPHLERWVIASIWEAVRVNQRGGMSHLLCDVMNHTDVGRLCRWWNSPARSRRIAKASGLPWVAALGKRGWVDRSGCRKTDAQVWMVFRSMKEYWAGPPLRIEAGFSNRHAWREEQRQVRSVRRDLRSWCWSSLRWQRQFHSFHRVWKVCSLSVISGYGTWNFHPLKFWRRFRTVERIHQVFRIWAVQREWVVRIYLFPARTFQ